MGTRQVGNPLRAFQHRGRRRAAARVAELGGWGGSNWYVYASPLRKALAVIRREVKEATIQATRGHQRKGRMADVVLLARGPRPRISAMALLAVAAGAVAVGALAIGSVAVGSVAIGRLRLKEARIGRLVVEDLTVARMHRVEATEKVEETGGKPAP